MAEKQSPKTFPFQIPLDDLSGNITRLNFAEGSSPEIGMSVVQLFYDSLNNKAMKVSRHALIAKYFTFQPSRL